MDYVVITGVPPWDGRYEFDVATFDPTIREWGWIKRLSGYLPLTMDEGLQGGDPELIAVLAVLAMRRAGKVADADVQAVHERFLDAPFGGTITLDLGGQVEDPTTAFPGTNLTGNAPTNGDDSPTNSATLAASLPPTGTHGWATSE